MLDWESLEYQLHECTEIAWGVFRSHRSNQVLEVQRLRREGKEFPVIRMDWNLPKTLGKIHRGEEARVLEALDGVLNARERVDHFRAAFIDLAEVC